MWRARVLARERETAAWNLGMGLPAKWKMGFLSAGLFLLGAKALLGAIPQPNAEVVLPEVEVKGSLLAPEKEKWRYTKFGDVDVLSQVADGAGRRLLIDLHEFQRALHAIYPALAQPPADRLHLLFARDRAFADLTPVDRAAGPAELSLLLQTAGQFYLVINTDASVTLPTDDEPALSAAYSTDISRQLYRQYLRYLLAGKNVMLPPWLEEGLSQTLSDLEIGGKWVTYGRVDTEKNMPLSDQPEGFAVDDFLAPNPAISDVSFKQVFAHRKFMPLGAFFTAKMPDGSAPSRNSAWGKQADALVHFCLFGPKPPFRAALIKFANALRAQPVSEPLFVDCFGLNYSAMQSELWSYLLHTAHTYQRYPLAAEGPGTAIEFRFGEASDADISALEGGALLASGHENLAVRLYHDAYLRGAREPDFIAGYADALARTGEKDRALNLVDAAVTSGTPQPAAYVLQARLRLEHFVADPSDSGTKLTPAQVVAVLTPLFAARKLSPPLAETYELIAAVWLRSSAKPKPENLAVLDEGIRRFPGQTELLLNSAVLYQRIGDSEKFDSIVQLGLRLSHDAKTRARFEKAEANVTEKILKPDIIR